MTDLAKCDYVHITLGRRIVDLKKFGDDQLRLLKAVTAATRHIKLEEIKYEDYI